MRAFARARSQPQQPSSCGLAGSKQSRGGQAPPPHFTKDLSRVPAHAAQPFLQKKLAVNQPGDEYEHEADRVASQVMSASPRTKGGCGCAGACAKCQSGAKGEGARKLQTKRVGAAAPAHSEAPPIVHEVLATSGRPLDSSARRFLEPRFGHDFSDMRVHADARASESAAAVGASAYTVGSHMVFGSGRYAPETNAGRSLLAHELTHSLQQGGAQVLQRQPLGGGSGDNSLPCPLGQMRLAPDLPCFPVTLPGRDCPIGQIRMSPDLPCFPWRPERTLLPGRLRLPNLTPPNVDSPMLRPPTGTTPGTTTPGTGTSAAASPCAASAATTPSTAPTTGCRYTVNYSNCREVPCDQIWLNARGTPPPGPLCGAAIQYDITSVTATGPGCPRTLAGLSLREVVSGDGGCTPPGYQWALPKTCVIGAGGAITGCTDTYSLCGLTSGLGGSCTEVVTQDLTVDGHAAETHEITFSLTKSGTNCTGTVRRD